MYGVSRAELCECSTTLGSAVLPEVQMASSESDGTIFDSTLARNALSMAGRAAASANTSSGPRSAHARDVSPQATTRRR